MDPTVTQHIERIIAEGAIGMTETARLLGTFCGGKKSHPSTPTRWCLTGVRLGDGRILRLEHYRTAGRLMTSRAALVRFLAAQQQPIDIPDAKPRSLTERKRANDLAEEELTKAGV